MRKFAVALLLSGCTLPPVVRVRDGAAADAMDDRAAQPDGTGADADRDVTSDVSSDIVADIAADIAVETSVEAGPEASVEGSVDAAADAVADVAMESSVDAAPDAARDAVADATADVRDAAADVVLPSAPAVLRSPVSGATTSGRIPRYTWSLPAGARNVRIQFHGDRTFAAPVGEEHSLAEGTTSWQPLAPIPLGTTMAVGHRVFWRIVHAGAGGDVASSPWQVHFPSVHSATSRVGVTWDVSRDVNGDGFDDLVVGAPLDFSSSGFAALYTSAGASIGAATALTRIEESPRVAMSMFAGRIAWAGDINGDGFGDVMVSHGSLSATLPVSYYLGSATGLVVHSPLQLTAVNASFGYAIAALGDINGDGFGDVAVGTPSSGTVNLYRGSATGTLSSAGTLTNTAASRFGNSIVGACDFNGDGRSDLAVGAPGLDTRGSVLVYLNSGGATPYMTAQTLTPLDSSGDFGMTMSCAGDVDGDGDHELVVGSPGGALVSVFRGQPTVGTPLANGVRLHYTVGPGSFATTGGFGVGVGDLDRDGFDDVVVSDTSSRYFVYFNVVGNSTDPLIVTGMSGSAAALVGAGDLDRDGAMEFALGSTFGTVSLREVTSMGATPERFGLSGDTGAGFGRALSSR